MNIIHDSQPERTATAAELAGHAARIERALTRQRARAVVCPLCWARPGAPCMVTGPPGDHLSRLIAAAGAGQVSRDQLAEVVGRLVVIADHVIVPELPERAS
ncbi:MAG: hypothetical protein ACLP52_02855 [Streptosporangiaceae bacterium]